MAGLREEIIEKDKQNASHEKHVKKLTNKLQLMFVNNTVEEKPLWEQVKADSNPAELLNKHDERPPKDNHLEKQQVQQGAVGSSQRRSHDFTQEINELQQQNSVRFNNFF